MSRKTLFFAFVGVLTLVFLVPSVALAQEGGAAAGATTGKGLGLIGAGLGMAIAAGLCGLGQGRAIGAACDGIARNPGAAGTIRAAMMLGVAFIESLVLFSFVVMLIALAKL